MSRSEPQTPGTPAPSLSVLLLVDRCCDRFENALRDGGSPRIEDFLDSEAPGVRAHLLRELLTVELEHCAKLGQTPSAQDYRTRFPADTALIDEVFAQLDSASATLAPRGGIPARARAAHQNRSGLAPVALDGLSALGYEVRGELGRGGMGVVYLARKVALGRPCALKMILAGGHAGPVATARFAAEAAAVARLRHPGIVQIYHVGEVDGLPFLELEYVPGGSLADQLDGVPRPAVEAAVLIEALTRAIAEAHKLGIVHRDLKPANVLLDADGTPKIADFGLAKILDSDQGLTRSEAVVGSPSYMAPEQAEGQSRRVGPATDVYALGAIFYELLTGRPPFRATTALETLNQIRAAEPVPPSRLQPGLARDAETICLKCLQKDPVARYSQAEALADDLRRFVDGRPINARPISALERAYRAFRRKPLVAGLIALVLLLSAASFVLVATLWRRAERDRERAMTSLIELKRQSRTANDERDRAERNYALAREAVDRSYLRISQERLLNEPHMGQLRKDLLQSAFEFYQRLVNERRNDPRARDDLGRALCQLARIEGERASTGDMIAHAARARDTYTEILAHRPGDKNARRGLAEAHALLAQAERTLGRPEEARAEVASALALREALAKEFPKDASLRAEAAATYHSLATMEFERSRMAEAESAHRKAITIWQELRDRSPTDDDLTGKIASAQLSLGDLAIRTGRLQDAEAHYVAARDALRKLKAAHPKDAAYQRDLALTYTNLTSAYSGMGRAGEAEMSTRDAIALQEQLVLAYPEIVSYKSAAALSHLNLAIQCRDAGRPDEARDHLKRARALVEPLTVAHPEVAFYQFLFGYLSYSSGNLHRNLGDPEVAQTEYANALRQFEAIVAAHPDVPSYRGHLAGLVGEIGVFHLWAHRAPEAVASLERAQALLEALLKASPTDANHRRELGTVLIRLGAARLLSHDVSGARAACEHGIKVLQGIPSPTPLVLRHLARGDTLLGELMLRRVVPGDPEPRFASAIDLLRRSIAGGRTSPEEITHDTAFEPLRHRADFRALVEDLLFPRNPFAK